MLSRLLVGTALLAAACVAPQSTTSASILPRTSASVPEWPACGRVTTFPGATWPAPNASGWDAQALAEVQAIFAGSGAAAMMVVHRGTPVASWGSVDAPYTAQSVRKGLVSSLAGLLIADGALALDDTLEQLGIDDNPPLDPGERQATFEHLMLSRSGIMHSALYEVGGWKDLRMQLAEQKRATGGFAPGAYWIYNNWDFNAVGTVIEQIGGSPIGQQFAARVAGPTGMEDFRPESVEYTTRDHPAEQRFGNQSDHRAYVFDISTRDLARFGLLYLDCGNWNGAQVVPRDWVLASLDGIDTRLGRAEDDQQTGFGDYGYLWQIDRPGNRRYYRLLTRAPVYFATGNRGHLLMVAPYLDLVVALQPATVGGVGFEAQRRRAIEGSPEINDEVTQDLLVAILRAHPAADTAFTDN